MSKKLRWSLYFTLLLFGLLGNAHQQIYEAWMRFQLRNETIIVTLTTTPHRINIIQPTIATILKQNFQPQAIYLNLPFVFKRDNLVYTIPQWLIDEPRIRILRTTDYGPATKLLGLLEQQRLPNDAIIITLDDDIKYPRNTVLQLAYKAHLNPTKAIAICGSDPEYGPDGLISNDSIDGISKNIRPDASVAIAQGFAGVAYRSRFFAADIFAIQNAPEECIKSDDLYISFYLAQHGIMRQILNNRYINYYKIDYKNNIGLNPDALHLLESSTNNKHRVCLQYLKSKAPSVVF